MFSPLKLLLPVTPDPAITISYKGNKAGNFCLLSHVRKGFFYNRWTRVVKELKINQKHWNKARTSRFGHTKKCITKNVLQKHTAHRLRPFHNLLLMTLTWSSWMSQREICPSKNLRIAPSKILFTKIQWVNSLDVLPQCILCHSKDEFWLTKILWLLKARTKIVVSTNLKEKQQSQSHLSLQ